ncbi:hypothetical protein [Tsukamurella paurometabola]|uniref:hypothetical protein n=1 Tax=Tsukamurella paurometabola TaxID=2061 RepID=UPI0013DE8673|nr:hypothetical protein [Tsukamurella paurometabola]UEA83056.1 hypothetical protein LK411_22320 [Tsukamurella paurometabola]
MVELRPNGIFSATQIQTNSSIRQIVSQSHFYILAHRPAIRAKDLGDAVEFFARGPFDGFSEIELKVPKSSIELTVDNGGQRLIQNEVWFHSHEVLSQVLRDNLPGIASLDRLHELIKWKIAYVGMSYGSGEGSLTGRLKEHDKLPLLMDKFGALGHDIRIIPMHSASTSALFGPANEGKLASPVPDLEKLLDFTSSDGRRQTSAMVRVVENVLIAYFQPELNKRERSWPSVESARALRDHNARSVVVVINGTEVTYSLFSDRRNVPRRGFSLLADLHSPGVIDVDDYNAQDSKNIDLPIFLNSLTVTASQAQSSSAIPRASRGD